MLSESGVETCFVFMATNTPLIGFRDILASKNTFINSSGFGDGSDSDLLAEDPDPDPGPSLDADDDDLKSTATSPETRYSFAL